MGLTVKTCDERLSKLVEALKDETDHDNRAVLQYRIDKLLGKRFALTSKHTATRR